MFFRAGSVCVFVTTPAGPGWYSTVLDCSFFRVLLFLHYLQEIGHTRDNYGRTTGELRENHGRDTGEGWESEQYSGICGRFYV